MSRRPPIRGLNFSEWLYGVLLHFFPTQFRKAYATDAIELFRDRYREEYRRARGRGVMSLWGRSVLDTVTAGLRTRWDGWCDGAGSFRGTRKRDPRRVRDNGLASIVGDIRYSFRNLAREPGFTAVVVLTLAIGIGANTAIFSVVSGVLLRPLPYDNHGDLVAIWSRFTPESGRDVPKYPIGSPEYFDYVNQNETMERVAAVSNRTLTITGGSGEPEIVTAGFVSSSMFAVLRTPPLMGRTLIEADDGAEPRPVYVLSYDLWQRRFGGDSSVIGRTLNAEIDMEYETGGEIVGVMPEGFAFPTPDTEVWSQLPLDPARTWRGGHWFAMIGRLAPGVTYEQAEVEMETLMSQWAIDYPDHHLGHDLYLKPLLEDTVGDVKPVLFLLFGAVGFVLLIACANVANLMMTRSESRRREFAVRTALGAGKGRLIRQLLTDAFLLSIAGGAVGLVLASVGVRLLLALEGGTIPRTELVGQDGWVFLFTVAVVVATTFVFGLAPAVRAGRTNLQDAFRESGKTATASRKRIRFRGALVAGEVAAAILLVIGAGLMVKSFLQLLQEEPGFRIDNVLVAKFSLPTASYSGDAVIGFYAGLKEQIEALPNVASVTLASHPPLLNADVDGRFDVEGFGAPEEEGFCCTGGHVTVGQGFFETFGIRVLNGRVFDNSDLPENPPVVVVDRELARRYWPDEEPIGKRIRFMATDGPWATVIGVVDNVKYAGLSETYPIYYHLYEQFNSWSGGFFSRSMSVVIRTTGDPGAVAGPVRELVRATDPNLPVVWMRTMDDIASSSVARPRFLMTLMSVFASVALVLSAIGVYGVISHGVAQRTNEIGIRIALGAASGAVTGMFVRRGLGLAMMGTVVGVVAAVTATRLISGFLYNVSPTDPLTFAVVVLIILAVVLVASYLPARRASRVDPLVSLRME